MAPRLFLLPGLDGTGRLFDGFLPALGDGLDPVVVPYPTQEVGSFDSLAELVLAAMGPDERVLILAESFSGPVALQVALRAPERVMGLVLVASFIRPPKKVPLRWLRVLPDVSPAGFLGRQLIRQVLFSGDASRAMTDAVVECVSRVPHEVRVGRIRRVLELDLRDDVAALTVPTLYIRGTRDRLVGPQAVSQLVEACPSVHVETVEAPHLVVQAAPLAVAAIVRAFVAAIDGRPPRGP